MLLGILGARFLGNILSGKRIIKAEEGCKGIGMIRAAYGSKGSLIKDFCTNSSIN